MAPLGEPWHGRMLRRDGSRRPQAGGRTAGSGPVAATLEKLARASWRVQRAGGRHPVPDRRFGISRPHGKQHRGAAQVFEKTRAAVSGGAGSQTDMTRDADKASADGKAAAAGRLRGEAEEAAVRDGTADGTSQWIEAAARYKAVLIGVPVISALSVVAVALGRIYVESVEMDAWTRYEKALSVEGEPIKKLEAVESLLRSLESRDVFPFAVMHLARGYYDEAMKKPPNSPERAAMLDKALAWYETFNSRAGNHVLAPLGLEGEGLVKEEKGDLDGAIAVLSKAHAAYATHWIAPKLFYDLGRCHYLRYLEKGRPEDMDEARRWLGRAREFTIEREISHPSFRGRSFPFLWRRDVDFLMAVISKPGPAIPDGKAPPERKKEGGKPDESPAPAGEGKTLGAGADPSKSAEPGGKSSAGQDAVGGSGEGK